MEDGYDMQNALDVWEIHWPTTFLLKNLKVRKHLVSVARVYNIKLDIDELECEIVDCIRLIERKVWRQSVVNTVMKVRRP
jgi:hypothetical protein